MKMFQSTRPARGATLGYCSRTCSFPVSIHAPRAGRDTWVKVMEKILVFQSTRPARGATHVELRSVSSAQFQSTRPARGATPSRKRPGRLLVSIHAPRAGRDIDCRVSAVAIEFQSTRPARGATSTRP